MQTIPHLIRSTDYRARLDKTGLKVCCGYRTCRGQLGYVSEDRHVGGEWVRRELIMPPGWLPTAAGVWRLTNYAQKREDRDRNIWPLRRDHEQRAPRNRRGYVHPSRPAFDAPPDLTPHQFGAFIYQFPLVAICPVCHHRNILEADRLRVMTEEEYARGLGLDWPPQP